ncbi:hypothetical protein LEP1GSC062_1986 [Leptospira alexanderi serovar Manhao 3 str. L 60]|uniref:Lipoprotein n=1 Tax=Leptospira alexanderi serovar Manhao 3 str. L 60 TaxID=1049759 RepID=V6I6X8_9LEPT|nr:hypothetical protein LEP1GSC062_1986 [Leptospira alexanderi serovar Manhao 3 str. L 60]
MYAWEFSQTSPQNTIRALWICRNSPSSCIYLGHGLFSFLVPENVGTP